MDNKSDAKNDYKYDYSLLKCHYNLTPKDLRNLLSIFPVILSQVLPYIGITILEYYMPSCVLPFLDQWFTDELTTTNEVVEYPENYDVHGYGNYYFDEKEFRRKKVKTPYLVNEHGGVMAVKKSGWCSYFKYNKFMIFFMKVCSVHDIYMLNDNYNITKNDVNDTYYWLEQIKRHNLFLVVSQIIYSELVEKKIISKEIELGGYGNHNNMLVTEIAYIKEEEINNYTVMTREEYEQFVSPEDFQKSLETLSPKWKASHLLLKCK